MAVEKEVFVVMAGGSGTRFWPASRRARPKQFLKLFSDRSFLQQTVDRLDTLALPENIFVCATRNQVPLLTEDLPSTVQFLEPMARNTAPCLMLSVAELLKRGYPPGTPMVVLPADHYIGKSDDFRKCLRTALEFVRTRNALVTFGIVPSVPHTGYGYIEAESPTGETVRPVRRFVEKPNREKAEAFLKQGNFYWNSGIFVWTLQSICEAFVRYLPDDWHAIHGAQTPDALVAAYQSVTPVSVDVGILEKASNVFVLPVDFDWSDVGSWSAVFDLRANAPTDNVSLSGDVHYRESEGCLVKAPPGKQVALIGLKDIVVVDEGDKLLVLHKEKDQGVRAIAEALDTDTPKNSQKKA